MIKKILLFIFPILLFSSVSAFDFSLLDKVRIIKNNNYYQNPPFQGCKLKEINLQTFGNTNFGVNSLFPNIFPCNGDTDFGNNAFNESTIFSYQKAPGFQNEVGAVSSIVFLYERLTDFYIGYPYVKNGSFDFHYIEIGDDEKFSSTYYGQPMEYDGIVPLQWGFNLYKYNSSTDIKVAQYSNGLVYDGYYMNIEGDNINLLDFERKIIYQYLNVGNSFQTIGGSNFGGKIFSTLLNTSPDSVWSFDYIAGRNRIVQSSPAVLHNNLTPNVVVGPPHAPNFEPSYNGYSYFDGLGLYVNVSIGQSLAINTPAFYSVVVPPTSYATGSFSNYETASNGWFGGIADWITGLTSGTILDFNSTGSLLGSIDGLTTGSGSNNPILAPVNNLFEKIKGSYTIPNIFPKYSSCPAQSTPLGKIVLYGLFLMMALSLFFKLK